MNLSQRVDTAPCRLGRVTSSKSKRGPLSATVKMTTDEEQNYDHGHDQPDGDDYCASVVCVDESLPSLTVVIPGYCIFGPSIPHIESGTAQSGANKMKDMVQAVEQGKGRLTVEHHVAPVVV